MSTRPSFAMGGIIFSATTFISILNIAKQFDVASPVGFLVILTDGFTKLSLFLFGWIGKLPFMYDFSQHPDIATLLSAATLFGLPTFIMSFYRTSTDKYFEESSRLILDEVDLGGKEDGLQKSIVDRAEKDAAEYSAWSVSKWSEILFGAVVLLFPFFVAYQVAEGGIYRWFKPVVVLIPLLAYFGFLTTYLRLQEWRHVSILGRNLLGAALLFWGFYAAGLIELVA